MVVVRPLVAINTRGIIDILVADIDAALTQPQHVLDVSLELLPEGALGGRVARLARQVFVPGVHRA